MNQSTDPPADMTAILYAIPLFNGTAPGVVGDLARAGRIRRVAKDEVVFLQGEHADAIYFVQTGLVAIVLPSADGRELVINEMRPGDCFGELGMLTHQTHTADAVAREPGDLIAIPCTTFLAALDADPTLARRLLQLIAERLSTSSLRESALAFLDAQARLARVLLEMDRLASEKGYLTASQEELAQHSGLIRQTVAKILGKWRRAGWLITGRGHILLLDRKSLSQAALGGIER